LQNTEAYRVDYAESPPEGDGGRGYVRSGVLWLCLLVCGLLVGLCAAIEPALAAVAVLGLLVFPVAMRYIHIVILLLAVYTPFEEFLLKWMPVSIAAGLRFAPEALLVVLLMVLLFRNLGRGVWWKKTPIDLPLLLFLVFSVLSALAYDVPAAVWLLGIREFARYILLYYLVVNTGLTERMMKFLTVALLAAAALEAGIGLMQLALGNRFSLLLVPRDVVVGGVLVREGFTQVLGGSGRIFGTLGRYSRFGFFLALFCLLAAGFYVALRDHWTQAHKLSFFAFGAVVAPAMILSFSRTSWFALYAGGIVLLVLARWKKMLLLAIIVPVLATALLLSWIALEDWQAAYAEEASLSQRFASTFSPEFWDVLFTRGRLFIITRVSPIILREYTWLGLGPGTIGSIATGGGTNSPGLIPEYSHEDWLDVSQVGRASSLRFMHDVGWVSILAQVGLLGLGAYLWILAELARTALRCYRASADPFVRGLSIGYIALVAAVIVGNFATFSLTFRAISMYVWLFGAVVATFYLRSRRELAGLDTGIGGAGP